MGNFRRVKAAGWSMLIVFSTIIFISLLPLIILLGWAVLALFIMYLIYIIIMHDEEDDEANPE